MRRERIVLFSAALALVACILPVWTFVPTVFSMNGYLYIPPWHWNKPPGETIGYRIYANGSLDIPDLSEMTAIDNSFQTWEDDGGSYVDFTSYGTTPYHAPLLDPDTINEVDFFPLGSGGPIATTILYRYTATEILLEVDTVFNEYYNFSTNLAPYSYDVADVMTHEAGHWLSLNDTYDLMDSLETMFGIATFQETIKRTLLLGDIAGARYIYPNRYQGGSGGLGWWTAGADITTGNIDGAGSTDLVMLWIDNPSPNNYVHYRLGWNLNANDGSAASWSANKDMPGGIQDETSDAGVALVNLDGTSNLDMVVLWMDTASPHNNVYYKIGWNLNTAGDPASWSSTKTMPSSQVGAVTHGVGVSFANLDANSRPEMAVVWVDSPPSGNDVIYYKIGWNVNTTGDATSWSNAVSKTGSISSDPKGAGVTFANIDGDSTIDMVIFWVEDPSGANHGKYLVAYDVSSTGTVGSWSSVKTFPGDWQWVGDGTAGAGIAVADLNSNGRTEMIFLWIDDPYTENYAYYRVEWEGRVDSHS